MTKIVIIAFLVVLLPAAARSACETTRLDQRTSMTYCDDGRSWLTTRDGPWTDRVPQGRTDIPRSNCEWMNNCGQYRSR